MQQDSQGFLARFKFVLFVLVNVLIALLGTAIAETAIGNFVHPHSLSGVLWKEYSLSIGCAACLGFSLRRIWKTSAAVWAWLLPCLWFCIRIIPALLSSSNQSVLSANGGVLYQFSGQGCENGIGALECRNFFVFTIPFVRAAAYSVGAMLSAWIDPACSNSTATTLDKASAQTN